MKKLLLLLPSLVALSAHSQIYIKNVSLIDVEHEKIIPEQTVTIKGNVISAIQDSKDVKFSPDAVTIDGKGKFLMPGLIDAHVHFFQSGGLYTRPDAIDLRKYAPYDKELEWTHDNMEDFLRRYLREGITTVIDPGSSFSFLQERDSFAGKSFAPSVYMAGPLITTYEPAAFKDLKNEEPFILVSNVEEAKEAVQKQLPYHPDFIKIWYITSRAGKSIEESARGFQPIVKAAIDEAHRNYLRVAVHATERITAQLAVESGCDYLVHDIEDEVVTNDFINLLKKNHITLCPTLTVADGYETTFAQRNKFSSYELTRSNPQPLGSLLDLKYIPDTALVNRYKSMSSNPRFDNSDSIRSVNLKKMASAGVSIATGTDAGNIGTLHATSYMNELKAMQQSGMNNWQIIRASTHYGAMAIHKEGEFGSITVGKKADMILLDANPVEDLENLRKISYVINKGIVIMPDTLLHESPAQIVQRQLNAFNARNIDAFLDSYSGDAELYTYPDKLVNKGRSDIRNRYEPVFAKFPDIHCEIKSRAVQGNIVVDKEHITATGRKPFESIVIYHIENGKIKKAYSIK